MTVKFCYIGSGTGHLKAYNLPMLNDADTIQTVNNYINKIRTEDHKFGLLFNAHVEPRYGAFLQDYYKNCLDEIHADSGGLQIMSKGDTITPEMKKAIYGVQAKYSDVAMSFDQIPVVTDGKNKGPGSLNRRRYDEENFEIRAKESAHNISEQIREFNRLETSSKPMLILHGRNYDHYMRWHDICMNEIPGDLHKYIGGIAVASPAQGYGFTKDAEKAFVAASLSKYHKHFHILGVGSLNRMAPYIVFKNSGLFEGDTLISYDSTSHTMGISVGSFYNKNYGLTKITRQYSKEYNDIFEEVNEMFNLDMDQHTFYRALNSNSSFYYEDNDKKKAVDKELLNVYYRSIFGFFCKSVKNFMNAVDTSKSIEDLAGGQDKIARCPDFSIPIISMGKIRDEKEFKEWFNQLDRELSDSIAMSFSDTLDLDVKDISQSELENFTKKRALSGAKLRAQQKENIIDIESFL